MEIRKERGFPQQLEKSLAKDARLFHSSHRPNNKDLSIMFCRQRSTLIRLNFGPKDGEHLTLTNSLNCSLSLLSPQAATISGPIILSKIHTTPLPEIFTPTIQPLF